MLTRVLFLFGLLFQFGVAEIIDRIAVSLGNQVITVSEIEREIRIAAFLNGDKPDFSPVSRRKTADRLIEQKLIRKELELSHYAKPGPDEVEATVQEVSARFPNVEQFRRGLEPYGISEPDLRAHLEWQLTALRFIEFRFRQGIQITEPEIREYLEKQVGSKWREQKLTDETRDQIEETLIEQRVDKQLDEWIRDARKRTQVQIREEAFR